MKGRGAEVALEAKRDDPNSFMCLFTIKKCLSDLHGCVLSQLSFLNAFLNSFFNNVYCLMRNACCLTRDMSVFCVWRSCVECVSCWMLHSTGQTHIHSSVPEFLLTVRRKVVENMIVVCWTTSDHCRVHNIKPLDTILNQNIQSASSSILLDNPLNIILPYGRRFSECLFFSDSPSKMFCIFLISYMPLTRLPSVWIFFHPMLISCQLSPVILLQCPVLDEKSSFRHTQKKTTKTANIV